MVELKRKVTLKRQVTSPDEVEVTSSGGTGKDNRWKWIAVIVALLLAGGAIYYFNQSDSTDNADIAIVVSDSTSTQKEEADSAEVLPSDNTSEDNADTNEANSDNLTQNQASNVTHNKEKENT